MEPLITLAAAACISLVTYATLSLVFSEERTVSNRVRELSSYEANQALEAEPMLAPFSSRVLAPSMRRVGRMVGAITPVSYLRSADRALVLAGSPRGIDSGRLLAVQTMFAGLLAGLVFILRLLAGQTFLASLAAAFIVGAATFFIPRIWISILAGKRQDRIRKDLPDMLDMLLISVEAGLGFDAAVAKIVRRVPGPLGEEFGRMLQDAQAGLSRREALKRLGGRNDVPELSSFIMAMVQADVFGISVSNIMRAQSHELRVKRRQRAQEMAQKAPAKMVFPLILCILPATLIVVAGPAVYAIARAFGVQM